MSRSKLLDLKPDFLVSNNFESACQSILAQLQILIPAEQWIISCKDLESWILLYSNPGFDPDLMNSLSAHFDSILCQQGSNHIIVSDEDIIGLPLRTKNKTFSGVICAYKPQLAVKEFFEQEAIVNLFSELICYQLESEMFISQQKYKHRQLLNLSHTDSLTQLLNHRAWSQMLIAEEERAKRYLSSLAIFIMDLDKLKVTNDTKGHHAGDLLIINAAHCLRDVCRESDLVARLGGDEFGLLAIECDEAGAKSLLINILNALQQSSIEASVGYCVMTEDLTIIETMEIADKNMYKTKSSKVSDSSSIIAHDDNEVCH